MELIKKIYYYDKIILFRTKYERTRQTNNCSTTYDVPKVFNE
jgi:hypothetical protein